MVNACEMPCSSGDFQLKTMFGVGKIHLLRFGCMLCHFYPGGFTCLKHHLWSVNSHVESKTAIEESKTLRMMSLNQSFQPALIIAEFAENSALFRKNNKLIHIDTEKKSIYYVLVITMKNSSYLEQLPLS